MSHERYSDKETEVACGRRRCPRELWTEQQALGLLFAAAPLLLLLHCLACTLVPSRLRLQRTDSFMQIGILAVL